jgi:ketosteroid isomerase-like protein
MLTIEQRLEHLEDEAAIRDLVARFADAATRADYETVRSLFKPDAVFTIGEPFATTSSRLRKKLSSAIGRQNNSP